MTSKSDDTDLVDKIIEWCKDKYSRGECDSEVLKLYELACKASLYLSGRALDEQEYYDKYGNKIYKLAKEYGIYTSWDELLQSKRVRQTKWDNTTEGFKVPETAFMDVNERIRPAVKKNVDDHREAMEIMLGVNIGGRDD